MNHDEEDDLRGLLKNAFPPANTELGRDLWPAMLRRLETRSAVTPWYDWALAAAVVAVLALFPQWIVVLAYHL